MSELVSVLVVDDDETMRDLVSRMLVKAGFNVQVAEDGERAINALETGCYAAVLTDLVMPGKEGLETLVEIKRRWPACKVIVISGSSLIGGSDFLHVATALGADAALRKPVSAADLVATLARVLQEADTPAAI